MSKDTNPKQVIVIRKDLNMRKGKMIAQGAHASMGVILDQFSLFEGHYDATMSARLKRNEPLYKWLSEGFKKIVVYVESLDELMAIHVEARNQNVMTALIMDSGFTEFNGVPTYTSVAVGPDYPDVIDKITGDLPLL